MYALWRLAATTGMRRGELLGLRWLSFQDSEERETLRQRFHVDVWVPAEVTDSGSRRLGVWLTTAQAPSTVVRDQNRNRACAGTTWGH